VTDDQVILVPWPDPETFLPQLPPGTSYATFTVDDHDLPPAADRAVLYVTPYTFAVRVHEVMREMPALRWVQLLTAGYEHALPHLPAGVSLSNAKGVHDASTAELAMALMLAGQRELDVDARAMTSRTWVRGTTRALADCTVLIVGAGSIGAALERRLTGFETTVVKIASRARGDLHGPESLVTLLPQADVVVLLVPLTEETRGLMSADELAAMKPGALLVNVARGPVVDTDALVEACATGHVRAALDVVDPEPLPPEHPLWSTPGVLISPHRGGNSAAFLPRAKRLAAAQIGRFVAGEPLEHVVATG
jgi:phosphoglycerate dehydrogenase-like enzyme